MPDSLDVCCVPLHQEETDLYFLGGLKKGTSLTLPVLSQAVPEASWCLQEIPAWSRFFSEKKKKMIAEAAQEIVSSSN